MINQRVNCGTSRVAPPLILFPVHPKEQALLEYLRDLHYGTLYRLVVQDGLPVLVEETHPTHRF